FATDLYTPERGKRLFATIGVGASIGAVLGAFVPHMLHHLMGMTALLLVAAVGLALSILLYRIVDHRERNHRVKPAPETKAQAAVVAWLLTALGIRRALFVMPLIVLAGWFGLLFFTSLMMVRIEKTSENSLDYSLHNTLRAALFLPTSRAAKYKAKAAIDTFF